MKKLLIITLVVVGFAACQSGTNKTQEVKENAAPVQLVQTTFDIGGMDCDMCVKSVEKGVNELTGISSVAVSLDDSSAVVKYDASKVQLAEIGYKVKGSM